jgi:hypothetical protein
MKEFIELLSKNGKVYDIVNEANTVTFRFDNIQSSSRATTKNLLKKCGLTLDVKSTSSKSHLGSTIITVG